MAYETELDRQHEAEIARKLGDAWGVEFLHWPEFAQVDLIGYHNQRPTHMVEIKARNIPFTKYDTLVILKKKFLLLKWVEGAFGVKGYYVNEFSDKSLYYCQPALCGDDVRFSIINRSDGQCVPDREHACIPRRYWYEVRPRV